MVQALLFGVVQGVAEWLPVSSEGLVVLMGVRVFGFTEFSDLIRFALFLHLGTFLAALVYFRSDVVRLIQSLGRYRTASEEDRSLLRFLIIATAITGVVGGVLFRGVLAIEDATSFSGSVVTAAIGALLFITALLLLIKKNLAMRSAASLTVADAVIVGMVQGFAALPGLSRSGLTIATLLFRRIDDAAALRVSFLMSLPVVLGANIVLNASMFALSLSSALALLASFSFGLLTIHVLLALARRINIGIFVMLFALLMIGSLFL